MSETNFEQVGPADRASPSIWKSCRKTLVPDLGLGNFFLEDFIAIPSDTTAAGEQPIGFEGLVLTGDAATVLSAVTGQLHGVAEIATAATDNNAWALSGQPYGVFQLHSGKRMWLEGRIALTDVAMDGAIFLGWAEEQATPHDIIADNAGGLADTDLVGFQVLADDPNAVDAVFRQQGTATVEVLADITNAPAIPVGERASLTNNTLLKLGMSFDGKDRLDFFVNGRRVTSVFPVLTSTFPDNVRMGPILALKTGAIAAESLRVDWLQHAHQEAY